MTTRFIRVHGQARFTRKWLFEYLRNTRVTRQKVTYCRRRTMCNFLSALVAFLPSPSSSYHHGSVASDPPRDYAQKYEHAPFRSHVSRDLLIPQTLTRICGRTISRALGAYVPYLIKSSILLRTQPTRFIVFLTVFNFYLTHFNETYLKLALREPFLYFSERPHS